jgi:hypothetical protein
VLIAAGPLAAKPPRASLDMTVQACNSAGVEARTLLAAERETSRIFRDAGVTVAWLNCPSSIEPCPEHLLAITIGNVAPERYTNTSVGVALGEARATIFFPRVREYAKVGIATDAQILGHAMAHEMGHLLLGEASHSRFGLMRAQWTADELQRMAMGSLVFRPEQSALIRQELLRRMRSTPMKCT